MLTKDNFFSLIDCNFNTSQNPVNGWYFIMDWIGFLWLQKLNSPLTKDEFPKQPCLCLLALTIQVFSGKEKGNEDAEDDATGKTGKA